MPELIAQETRKARKPHRCDYCGEMIEKGEVYEYATLKFDGIYHWSNHVRCGKIAQKIWDYADPDEGMTADDYTETCQEVCQTFICPDCGVRGMRKRRKFLHKADG